MIQLLGRREGGGVPVVNRGGLREGEVGFIMNALFIKERVES